jgi:hypothetical protein
MAAANSDKADAIGDTGHGMVYMLLFPLAIAQGWAMISENLFLPDPHTDT